MFASPTSVEIEQVSIRVRTAACATIVSSGLIVLNALVERGDRNKYGYKHSVTQQPQVRSNCMAKFCPRALREANGRYPADLRCNTAKRIAPEQPVENKSKSGAKIIFGAASANSA